MAFSFEEWKKRQKKSPSVSKMRSFSDFKKEHGTPEINMNDGPLRTAKQVKSRLAARELDAQGPKSEKARQADADRFARGHREPRLGERFSSLTVAGAGLNSPNKQAEPESAESELWPVNNDPYGRKAMDAARQAGNNASPVKPAKNKEVKTNEKGATPVSRPYYPSNYNNTPTKQGYSTNYDPTNKIGVVPESKDTGKKSVLSLLMSDATRLLKQMHGLGEFDDGSPAKSIEQQVGRQILGATDKDNKNDTLDEKFGASARLGIGQTMESGAGAVRWLLGRNEFDVDTGEMRRVDPLLSEWIQDGADAVKDGFDKPENRYSKSGEDFNLLKAAVDPEFYATTVTAGVPQLASTMIPAFGAAKAIGAIDRVAKMPKVVQTMLKITGGTGVNTAMDSSLEAGHVYDEARRRGMTDQEAKDAANETFGKNVALTGGTSAIEMALGLTGLGKAAVGFKKAAVLGGKVGLGAAVEGFQEGAQEGISASALGDDFSWSDPGTLEAMLTGAILGGGMTGAMAMHSETKPFTPIPNLDNAFGEIMNIAKDQLPPEIRAEFERATAELVAHGYSEDNANGIVAEQLLDMDPEFQIILSNATTSVMENARRELESTAPSSVSPTQKPATKVADLVRPIESQMAGNIPPFAPGSFLGTFNDIGRPFIPQAPQTPTQAQAAPETTKKPKPKPQQEKPAKQNDVEVGDVVSLEGTRPEAEYKVENVEGDTVTVVTPNKKTIKVPKSKIQAVKNREMETAGDKQTKTESKEKAEQRQNAIERLNNVLADYEADGDTNNEHYKQVKDKVEALENGAEFTTKSVAADMIAAFGAMVPTANKTTSGEKGKPTKADVKKAVEVGEEIGNRERNEKEKPVENFAVGDTAYTAAGKKVEITELKDGRAMVKTEGGRASMPISELSKEPKPKEVSLADIKVGESVRDNREGYPKNPMEVVEILNDNMLMVKTGKKLQGPNGEYDAPPMKHPRGFLERVPANKPEKRNERDVTKLQEEYRKNPDAFKTFYRGEIVPVGDGTKSNMSRSILKKDEKHSWMDEGVFGALATPQTRIAAHERMINESLQDIKILKEEKSKLPDDYENAPRRLKINFEVEQAEMNISDRRRRIKEEEKNIEKENRYNEGKNNNLLFVTSQKETAEDYAQALSETDDKIKPDGYNPTVFEMKGKFDNTFTFPKGEKGSGLLNFDELAVLLEKDLKIPWDTAEEMMSNAGLENEMSEMHSYLFFRGENALTLPKYLIEQGYDSVNYTEGKQDNFIVFDRNKILYQHEWSEPKETTEEKEILLADVKVGDSVRDNRDGHGDRSMKVVDTSDDTYLFLEDVPYRAGSSREAPAPPKRYPRSLLEKVTESTGPAAPVEAIARIAWLKKKMRNLDYTAAELQRQFKWLRENEKKAKDDIYKYLKTSDTHKRKREATKQKLVESTYREALEQPAYGDDSFLSIRHEDIFGSIESQNESRIKQIEEKVNSITDESIAKHIGKIQAERDEKKKAVSSPETIKDFVYKRDTTGLTEKEQAKLDELQALAQKEKMAEKPKVEIPQDVVVKGNYSIVQTKHTKTGEDLWVVKLLGERLATSEFNKLRMSMKVMGGTWSKFTGGFNFKSDPTDKLEGEVAESTEENSVSSERPTRIAERLRTTADNMQKSIDDKRNDNRLTNTARRATQDAHARDEADRLERQQRIMRRIADAIESGEATFLDEVTARTHIEALDRIVMYARNARLEKAENDKLRGTEREKLAKQPLTVEEINAINIPKVELYPGNVDRIVKAMTGTKGLGRALARVDKELNAKKGKPNAYLNGELIREDMLKVADAALKNEDVRYYAESIKESYNIVKRLEAMNLGTPELLRSGIREYINYVDDVGENTGQKRKDEKRKREAELSKLNIPGFFPTPTKVIDRMLEEADIQSGMTVLEPSAGKGNIAERIRDEHGEAALDVVEYNNTLNEYLESQDFNVVANDFLEFDGTYDRILMNPPFEKGQDIDHVKHAFNLLEPGGRVVAIMSEGPFFRNDKKATGFREWLEEQDGVSEQLEEGSFVGSERTTGVATRLVTIDKPMENNRDTMIIERVDQKPFVVKRGDEVLQLIGKDFRKKTVKSISQSKQEINGTPKGFFYPLDYVKKKTETSTDDIAETIKKEFKFDPKDISNLRELSNLGVETAMDGRFKVMTKAGMKQKDSNWLTILSLMSDSDVIDVAVSQYGHHSSADVFKGNRELFKTHFYDGMRNSGSHGSHFVDKSRLYGKNQVEIKAADGRTLTPTFDEMWKRFLNIAGAETAQPSPEPSPKSEKVSGNEGIAYTEKGTKIEFEYRLVEANDLIASNDSSGNINPNYPEELQPRDRTRKASQAQIQDIAQKLNPELLGESAKASDGAPIVGPDMVVESGNGRTIAMKKMYEENMSSFIRYTTWLENNAERFGSDRKTIEDMDSPVLVRVRKNDVDRKAFVNEANESNVAVMSAVEQAKVDAEKLTNRVMYLFTPAENGDMNVASNRAFITAFIGEVAAQNDRGRLLTKDGNLSQDGLIRVRNAVFAKAYGNTEALSLISENTDNNVKTITNAMLQSAPRFAKMKDKIKNGELYDLDITTEITEAAEKLVQLRAEGVSVQTFMNQITMFDDISDLSKDLLKIYDSKEFKRSTKAINELFGRYVNVLEAAGIPNQINLFEKTMPTKAETLEVALGGMKNDDKGQTQIDLFDDATENPNGTGKTNSAKRQGKSKAVDSYVGTREKTEEAPPEQSTESVVEEAPPERSPEDYVVRSEIVDFVRKKFKVAVDVGKFRQKARGIYKNKFAIIRTQQYGDFEVIAHELGHSIDKRLGITERIEFMDELVQFANANLEMPKSYDDATRAREGVAEYFRQYLYRNGGVPNISYTNVSPELKQFINDGLTQRKWTKHLESLEKQIQNWITRDAKQEIQGITSNIGENVKPRFDISKFLEKAYTNIWDEDHPIYRAMKRIEKETGIKLESHENAYALAVLTRGTVGRAITFVKGYTFDATGTKTGESLEKILKDVDDITEFSEYLVAKRAHYLKTKRGKSETPITIELVEPYLAEMDPRYAALAKRIYDYQDRVLQVLVDGGLIESDLPVKLRENDPYYVPFYRVMTESGAKEAATGGDSGGGGFVNTSQGLREMKLKGSARNIINPIESIIKNTHMYVALADRNSVGRALANLANPNSPHAAEVTRDIIEAIPFGMGVTEFSLKSIRNDLIDAGLTKEALDDMDMDSMAKLFKPLFKPNTAANEILVWQNGTPKLYKVRDTMLYNSLVAQDNAALNDVINNVFFKAAEHTKNALRTGITANPVFVFWTSARSMAQLAVKTEATGINYVTHPFRVIRAMGTAIGTRKKGKSDEYWEWMSSGAGQSTLISVETKYLQRDLERLALKTKTKNRLLMTGLTRKEKMRLRGILAKNALTAPINFMNRINDTLDSSIKIAEYQVVKKQTGGDRIKAALASREADLDYKRKGAAGMDFMNRYWLFWNVAVQGPENLARTFVKHPIRTSLRGFVTLSAPTILLYLINRDDEEYQELESYEKDLYWNYPLGDGTFLKLRIPFEAGLVFKTMAEKITGEILDYARGEDKSSWDDFGKNAASTLVPGFLPVILEVGAEYIVGADIQTVRETVPSYMKSMKKKDQYFDHTSETAKLAGKALNQSPIKLEHAFTGTFGQLGQGAIWGMDMLLDGTGVVDKPDTTGLRREYWGKQFSSSVEDGTTSSITDFYKYIAKLEAEHEDTGVSGVPSAELKAYRKARDDIRDLRKLRQDLMFNRVGKPNGEVFTKEEKKEQITFVNKGMRDIARFVQLEDPIDEEGMYDAIGMARNYRAYLNKKARDETKVEKARLKREGK